MQRKLLCNVLYHKHFWPILRLTYSLIYFNVKNTQAQNIYMQHTVQVW